MISFLKTIGIEDYESFDIDFESVGRNRFDRNIINMVIFKKTPWEYELLRRFQEGLNTINTYKYTLRFSYENQPTVDHVISLLNDWHTSIYRLPLDLEIKVKGIEELSVIYQNKAEQDQFESVIKDFKDFLKFLSYDFIVINEETKEELPEVSLEEKEESIEKASVQAEEDLANSENDKDLLDRNDVLAAIEQEQEEKNLVVGDVILKQMEKNYEQMRIERERMRLNRRGQYTYIEKIDDITLESDHVDFNGNVFEKDVQEIRGGETKKLTFGVSDDHGGAIICSCFQNSVIDDNLVGQLLHSNVRIRGVVFKDRFSGQLQIRVHNIDLLPPEEVEPEPYEQNRVELHLHTNMSTQDGINKMVDYCNYAKKLGHTAIAITDHGCVQGFPDAQKAADLTGLKVLYGCEFYMVDDELRYIFNPSDVILDKATYVVFDLETTGLSARYDRIIEFGAVKISGGRVVEEVDILINPKIHIPYKITEITHITDEMVENKETISRVLPKIMEFIGDSVLVSHNASFDFSFLNEALINNGCEPLKNPVVDTLTLSRYLFPENRLFNLGALSRRLEVDYQKGDAHRANYDAFVLSQVWHILLSKLTKDNINIRHKDLLELKLTREHIKHLRSSHVTVLAKNMEGIRDLYKLVSISNIEYLSTLPNIPKRELQKYRKNLLIGSACLNGEVFKSARYDNAEQLESIVDFYDYIEVQPPENYSFLVNMGELEEEQVKQYIKDIIAAGQHKNKIVVATGDVHYLSSREKVFRDVYIYSKQVGGIAHPLNPGNREKMHPFPNPDQHYRTTAEMLDCFAFLEDEELIKDIVIKNTNLIADMIENLKPVPNDKLYTPHIENSEQLLKDLCYGRAYQLYGNPLPEVIQNRLDTELNGIITHGYSVIYYIAHKLVKKTNEDGYIVGSRGSVGSSFVATMAGITEVNPLPPHYLCPKCQYLEWGEVNHPDIKSGFDLPAKICPICGENLNRDGQNIPFETFLGFHAEKVPDIDLNFPGDYQSTAHDYTKVLLGSDNVFRAGTIETVAEKTAFGFARGYIERLAIYSGLFDKDDKAGLEKYLSAYPKAKIDYLASGCVGVKRTTGQHPGGIVVVPNDHTVYDFTPIQWPADEIDSKWKTTHFDFHSIHDTILKLDMLGHVDPVALKMMCDLTHIKIEDIPMSDPKVFSIFSKPDALNLKHNYLNEETGALAIPEFGTEFVRGILEKTHPTQFNDLVIISGLSHGTNVWNGNAEKLINSHTATLQEVIGCRDDIMTYLINKGLPPSVSFSIMEDVRKGRGLKEEYLEVMRAHNVPQYYIDSCNKIKYMFPKGHAVAYVTMAIRVGYFKVYHPLEFYATFFSVRSKQHDLLPMLGGEEAIIKRLDFLKNKEKTIGEKLTPKEEEQIKTLQIALEMVDRGYKFSTIDLYRSEATQFVVDHENKALICPFTTIDGLGENNAKTVIEERAKGPFTSKKNLLTRTKLTSTNVDELAKLGVLAGLSDEDQMSLFDFDF